jgi:predicted dehydrogenase
MTKTYRVGFLGFGFIGKVHAAGYLNLPLYYEPVPLTARITHVCTSRLETARQGAAQVGAAVATTDWRSVTENPEVDIVHICTPNHLHRDALLSAMAHQKHIYCDKPLTATLAEAEAIRAALPAYRGTAQMTLQNRFFPATMRARQLIAEGAVGRVLAFRASFLHAGSVSPGVPLKWKLSAEAGGGVIADLGAHVFDILHWLAGDFASLHAASFIAHPRRPSADDPQRQLAVDAEDHCVILARLASGALGTIECTKVATGTEDEMRFEIHGERGALHFNLMDSHHLEFYDQGAPDQPQGGRRGWTRIDCGQRYPKPAAAFPSPKCHIGWMRGHLGCLGNFLCDVAAGRPGEPGLAQGIYVQQLIAAAQHSAATGQWVNL